MERILRAEEPNKKGHVRSIVVAPTKELASQIYNVLRELLRHHAPSEAILNPPPSTGEDDEEPPPPPPGPYIIPQALIGGRTKLKEDLETFAELNPNVLIATPKRLVEVLQSPKVIIKRHWFDLLVLDEADRLLDPNFAGDLQSILQAVPKERRTGLFSASVSEAVNELVRVGMRYPFKISAKVRSKSGALDKRTPESLKLCYVTAKPTHKLPLLRKIMTETKAEKSIVYVSTRAGVDYWNHVLPSVLGTAVFPLHGDHKAAIRAKNLQRFTDTTKPAILLTTDVLARGIDIPEIDLVVQLDVPSQPKDFIHRCGRTGRAGRRGMAITFLNQGSEEDYVKYLDLQGTKVEAYPGNISVTDEEAAETIEQIRQTVLQKRELHDRAAKAFVSWVQAYTKTLPADIFNIKHIDWAEVGRSWGLLRWPKMPELKRYYPEAVKDRKLELSVPAGVDLANLAYADKVRESKRIADMEARGRGELPNTTLKGGKAAEMRRRKEKAWSSQKDAKALREERRGRKEVRRKAEREGKMTVEEKAKVRELDDMIAKTREEMKGRMEDDGGFEGFGD